MEATRRDGFALPTRLVLFTGAIAGTATTIAVRGPTTFVVPILLVVVAFTLTYHVLLRWRALLAAIILVILFVPMRIYSLPASLPIHLEPYRLLVAFVAALWLAALLVDPAVRWQSSGIIDKPLGAFLLACVVSLVLNTRRFESVSQDATKAVLFFMSYVLMVYLVASLVRTKADLDFQVKLLVYSGAVVALFCLIEKRTHFNVFDHLSQVIPILRATFGPALTLDYRGYRVMGSSQDPIAMGVALLMLVPLALYRAFAFRHRLSWIAAILMILGAAVTISRTAVVTLAVIIIVIAVLKPRRAKRAWPAILPALLVIHFAAPGTIGTIESAFFPRGGLIAQQEHARVGSGRLATLGPALREEWEPNPIFGEGFGTRVTVADQVVKIPNGPILDDQWLGILLETGVVGAVAFAWLFVRFMRRIGGAARRDDTPLSWLLAAIAASVAGFGVSMFFFDALSFIQVTFLFFILIGLGSSAYRIVTTASESRPAIGQEGAAQEEVSTAPISQPAP